VTVEMAGGTAIVDVDIAWNIHLTGTVQSIASGTFSADFLANLD